MIESKSVVTRKEACQAKLTRYFLGVPCRNGHICERYTNSAHCVECDKIDRKKYRNTHRESIKAQTKRYRAKKLSKKLEEPVTTEKKEYPKIVEIQLERKLAKPIPAPDWSKIGWSHESIVQRAEEYREAYNARKNSR